jgi:O-acetylhomoserine/O-acetylserine sulfhydrylase-like pyridoxal-dependent enzyme
VIGRWVIVTLPNFVTVFDFELKGLDEAACEIYTKIKYPAQVSASVKDNESLVVICPDPTCQNLAVVTEIDTTCKAK